MDDDLDAAMLPMVSVIMTALNERRHLADAVASVFAQDYPGEVELVVAVGPSRDSTLRIAEKLAERHDRMRVVHSPSGRTPAGLNIALAAADPTSSVIVRTDGHAQLPPSYVRQAVATLQQTKAANVGGMMVPDGTTFFERAVARAMCSRIGLGSAPFHVGGEAGPAASVYLGVFQRDLLTRTSGFDERFVRAQDWELNHRIRELGGVVWFDPRLKVSYRPRPNIMRLARQFRASGMWRWQIVRRYPATLSLRYLAAPLATGAVLLAAALLVIAVVALHSAAFAMAAVAVPAAYVVGVLVGCAATRRGLDVLSSVCYPAVVVTMHMAWGAGFLGGLLADGVRGLGRPRSRSAARAPQRSGFSR